MACNYYNAEIYELGLVAAVDTYYDRKSLGLLIQEACADDFISITAGGVQVFSSLPYFLVH